MQRLPDEDSVQRWVAEQLETRKKDAYSIQREAELADAKAPDIVVTSLHRGVDLPIEIKVVDKMTVAEMETALHTQLCGQYLRHASSRHGILLLVYQNLRPGGWALNARGPLVPFSAVLEHLQNVAQTIRAASSVGPQPIVVGIDVSSVVPLAERRKQARAKTARRKQLSDPAIAEAPDS